MQRLKLPILFCLVLILNACSKEETKTEIPYTILYEGDFSYSEEEKIQKQFRVFDSEKEWLEFLQQIEIFNPDRAEILENQDYDFESDNLVIIIGEFYNYCCSEIYIHGVYRTNGEIYVEFDETGPTVLTALSQAFVLLKIDKKN